MSYELLVGLQVTDTKQYQAYREAMMPLLAQYGGGFRYDFSIDKTIRSASENVMNRVFTIHFKDKQSMQDFFVNEEYLKVKQKYYLGAVEATTIISEYELCD